MKFVLLSVICLCSSLALLPVFAQDQPRQDESELIEAASALKPWTGYLNGMIRTPRHPRPGGSIAPTSYWLNGARQTGAEYELLKAFQEDLNSRYQAHGKHINIHVVFIPTARDRLIQGLLEGRGDIAAGILTVTPERLEKVRLRRACFVV